MPSHNPHNTIQDLLKRTAAIFSHQSDSALLDAQLLLCYVLQKNKTYLYTHNDQSLTIDQIEQFDQLLQQRMSGTPIAYLVGEKEFWSLTLKVTPDVLIPRPDTEILVQTILNQLPKNKPLTIADLGTGSGAIAIALATERPHWQIIATDQSEKALAIAQENAQTHHCKNITFLHGNWCNALTPDNSTICHSRGGGNPGKVDSQLDLRLRGDDTKYKFFEKCQVVRCDAFTQLASQTAFPPSPAKTCLDSQLPSPLAGEGAGVRGKLLDAIISNPPYIDINEPELSQGDVRFEPKSALIAQDSGLADIKIITTQSHRYLKPGGLLAFEHGYQQAETVKQILLDSAFEHIQHEQDLARHVRVTFGYRE